MNAGDPPDDGRTPAELRLAQHLELLRASPPTGGPQIVAIVVRNIRWQRAVREPLVLVGTIGAALLEGLGVLFRPPSGGS